MGGKGSGAKIKHGGKVGGVKTPEYKTWLGMKARCYRKTHKDYPNWGGRGIRVCERWVFDFQAFLDDMGPRPDGYSIDRLDSNKDYGPNNCRWATAQQQASENRRGIKPVTVLGVEFRSQSAACRHFKVLATTVNERLKAGIDSDQAYSIPERLKSRRTRESYWPKTRRN